MVGDQKKTPYRTWSWKISALIRTSKNICKRDKIEKWKLRRYGGQGIDSKDSQ